MEKHEYSEQPGLIVHERSGSLPIPYSSWSDSEIHHSAPYSAPPPLLHHPHSNMFVPPQQQHQPFLPATPDYSYTGNGTYVLGPPQEAKGQRKILGLVPVTFFLLLSLILVVIVAAVGGGVGGSMAVSNAKTACLANLGAAAGTTNATAAAASILAATAAAATTTATITVTASNTASTAIELLASSTMKTWGPAFTTVPYTGCPDNNGSIYTTTNGKAQMKIYCNLDLHVSSTSDLLDLVTNTFALCMEACGSWNSLGKQNGGIKTPCVGVAFIPAWVNDNPGGGVFDCVLKSNSTLFIRSGYVVHSAVVI